MNRWKAIPLLRHSVEFLQMHSCGQRRNGKYVADVKYGVWMAARCCIEAAEVGRGARESATQARHVWPIQRRPNGHPFPSFPVQHRFNAQISPTVGLYRALSRISKAICVSSVLKWTIFHNSAQWSWSWSAQCLPTLPFREQFCLDSVKTSWAAALPLKWPIPQSINSDQHDNKKPGNFTFLVKYVAYNSLYVLTLVQLLGTLFLWKL